MQHPLWDSAVLYAEAEQEREKMELANMPSGDGIPEELMHQAIIFHLAGWSWKDIAGVVGRSDGTIKYWRRTRAWAVMREKLLLNKLEMYLLDHHLTFRQLLRESIKGHTAR